MLNDENPIQALIILNQNHIKTSLIGLNKIKQHT